MNRGEFLIEKAIKLYESDTGWGDSNDWTNQDFVVLSQKIQQRTGETLSYVTLKRVWGKVKYESLPSTHTLNTLVQFLGYESWRDFKSQNGSGVAGTRTTTQIDHSDVAHGIINNKPEFKKRTWILKLLFRRPIHLSLKNLL